MEKKAEEKPVMHSFRNQENASLFSKPVIIAVSICIVLGIATGYLLANKDNVSLTQMGTNGKPTNFSKGATMGTNDTSTFKDTAEGALQKGGISDEGQYHLVRPGGDSQNVYLTSSIVDLSQVVGKKVKIWGQ